MEETTTRGQTPHAGDLSPDAGAVDARQALAAHQAVVAAAAGSESAEGGLAAVARALKAALSLTGAHIYLLDSEHPEGALRLSADAGAHSVFVMEAPSVPLDVDTPAVRAVTAGEPTWEQDAYGVSGGEQQASGLARWRASVSAQASATLPLSVRGRVVGALTLEWPEPHAFDATERELVEGLAQAVAVAVDSLTAGEGVRVAGSVSGTRGAAFALTGDGRLAPAGGGRVAADASVLVSVATPEPGGDPGRASFRDVFLADDGTVVVVLGVAGSSGSDAFEAAETARHMVRGWMTRGIGPAGAVGSLAEWVASRHARVTWLAVTAATYDPVRRFVVTCSAGPALLLFRGADGRAVAEGSESPLLGGDASIGGRERTLLLLPGDRVGFVCADRPLESALAGGEPTDALTDDVPAADAAAAVIDRILAGESACAAAAVIEVLAHAVRAP